MRKSIRRRTLPFSFLRARLQVSHFSDISQHLMQAVMVATFLNQLG
jgi:hypothetical protein